VGDTFTVSLKFENMTNLAGIEYKIYWNKTVLNYVSVIDTLPWGGTPFIAKDEKTNDYNDTHGRFWYSVVDTSATPYTGDGTIRQITFNITNAPVTDATLFSLIDIQDDIFGDYPEGNAIPHNTYDGEFSYIWVVPEFSGATLFAALLATTAALIVYVRYFKRGKEFPK
jgi:hypothetical protein